MVVEAVRARRNEIRQLARGGIRPSGDVHEAMRIIYPGAFLAMLVEGALRHTPSASVVVLSGALLFAGAKLVKWAAILALGPSWTFRVIVVPGDALVSRGPYRFMRHPNYVGVIGELIGAALMTGAVITGPLAVVGFSALMHRRIAVEERALEHTHLGRSSDRSG